LRSVCITCLWIEWNHVVKKRSRLLEHRNAAADSHRKARK
jgi:hypothetical protein